MPPGVGAPLDDARPCLPVWDRRAPARPPSYRQPLSPPQKTTSSPITKRSKSFNLVFLTTDFTDSIRIKGRGVGIGIRYLSVQSVVKNQPAGRFPKAKFSWH